MDFFQLTKQTEPLDYPEHAKRDLMYNILKVISNVTVFISKDGSHNVSRLQALLAISLKHNHFAVVLFFLRLGFLWCVSSWAHGGTTGTLQGPEPWDWTSEPFVTTRSINILNQHLQLTVVEKKIYLKAKYLNSKLIGSVLEERA